MKLPPPAAALRAGTAQAPGLESPAPMSSAPGLSTLVPPRRMERPR
ncbi:hypothetical protein [Roseateles sp.]|uniref:Uncharacterized protein n=1 Tax=Pelomonas caseinilytica TaxID=2906763 RepID=A0ABS8X958_9BURK|nr:hypothetical protein [Pelomonas sp. P7]HEV6966674.1 hypothetical protein [Roseateles sp.]